MSEPTQTTSEDAIEAGIEAASDAVSGMAMGQKAWGAKEFEIARTAARAAVAAIMNPCYTLRRDDQGFAAAIERDGYTMLILATGAERNEQEAQAIVNALTTANEAWNAALDAVYRMVNEASSGQGSFWYLDDDGEEPTGGDVLDRLPRAILELKR